MNTQEVGQKLVDLCKLGKNTEAIQTLYAQDIVSVEAASMPGMPAEMRGIEAILGKTKWWQENNQVHHADIQGPFPHGDRFAVYFHYDITQKSDNKRITMKEVGLYTVKSDKVVREEFYYST